MEKFADILKLFFEKHLIPTVIAISTSLILWLYVPSGYWMIKNIGELWFCVLVSCVVFLIIELLIAIYNHVISKKSLSEVRNYNKKREKEKLEKNLKKVWSIIDDLPVNDREFLWESVKTNNTPVEGYRSPMSYRHETIGWILTTKLSEPKTFIKYYDKKTGKEIMANELTGNETESLTTYYNLYKLDDEIFNLLKYSYKKYGRISNFDV